MPEEYPRQPGGPGDQQQWSYSLHPLPALDGVLIHVMSRGETVDFYFGESERAAAAAVAADLLDRAAGARG